MNQQSSRIGGKAKDVGVYRGDKWDYEDGSESFYPERIVDGYAYGITQMHKGDAPVIYPGTMPHPFWDEWTLAAENSTPPPLSGEPLPERPKERVTRIGRTARELHESGDGPREGDEFERVTTSGMAPAYWVGYGFELNAHSNGEIRHGDGVTTLDCYRLTREGVSEADFRARWGKESRIGKTFGELKETRKGDVWEDYDGDRVLVLERGTKGSRHEGVWIGSGLWSAAVEPTRSNEWWVSAGDTLIAEGRDESNWLDGVDKNEESEPDDTPLAESRQQFDAASEEADPMERVGDMIARRSVWLGGFLLIQDSGAVRWEPATLPGGYMEFGELSRGNEALRALFGVEHLERKPA